jgi:hypothetical protein
MKALKHNFSPQDATIYRFLRIYLVILITEGIFRKWIQIFPFDLFYFLRDLIGFLFCLRLLTSPRFRIHAGAKIFIYQSAIPLISIAIFYATVVRNVPLSVALFGARNYLSLLPIGFILLYLENTEEVFQRLYSVFISSLSFQFPVVVLQVLSGPDAFINKTGWDQGASLFTSGQVVRPPGTFTNALGLGYYLLICYGLVLGARIRQFRNVREANVNTLAFFSIVGMSALAGSRTVILGLALTTILYLMLQLKSHFSQVSSTVVRWRVSPILSVFLILSTVTILYKLVDVIDAFAYRIRYQTEGSSGTLSRVLESIFGYHIEDLTWFGSGIGTRHQSAIALGWIQPWVENETIRWSAELGIFGFVLVVGRQFWVAKIAFLEFFQKPSIHYFAPIVFVSLGPILLSGVSTQPSVQGLSAVLIGLLLNMSRFRRQLTFT